MLFMWGVGLGNVFLAFYAISNISRKIIEKCPFTYWLNGRWFLQIVDIGNFNMKLNRGWFPQTGTVGIYVQYITQQIVVLASEPVDGRSRATELPCYGLKLTKFFAFSGFNFYFYSQFGHLCRRYILATKTKVPPRENPTRNTPYTTVVRTPTMADFVVEKYDGGVQMPSQSIKIYRNSLKTSRNVIN